MRTPIYTNRFEKDLKLMIKRGSDPKKIKSVLRSLIEETPLARTYRDHLLIGNFKDRRECHIEPDWLLIYRIDGDRIIFERTGTHADLFKC
jgi:mRNA interferase YafQ